MFDLFSVHLSNLPLVHVELNKPMFNVTPRKLNQLHNGCCLTEFRVVHGLNVIHKYLLVQGDRR